jgi:hypothetical protein
MSTHAKRAAPVIAVLFAFMIYRVMSSVQVADSGGLGAVSVGAIWAIFEFLWQSLTVYVFFYWWHRRHTRKQIPAPRP